MNLGFGLALDALETGHKVRRAGWNGKGMFLYIIKGVDLQNALGYGYGEYIGEPSFVSYVAIKTAQNTISPWQPSNGDMLAKDWEVCA